jgi:CheY-like chemotaxis protein
LHLPRHDGFEILEAIRQSPAMSKRHVIVTTNGASPKEESELQTMGIEYRLKPRDLAGFEKLASDLVTICNG